MSYKNIKLIIEKFPFLSYGNMGKDNYLGIIQNIDTNFVSMYRYDLIQDIKDREMFLILGNTWWWNSNRKIPINIFLGERFLKYRHTLSHFSKKEFNLVHGHIVSIQEMLNKRIRRQSKMVQKIESIT